MKSADLILHCYAEQDKNKGWYAVCLDLNLVAYSDNLQEVRSKLHRMMFEYVKEALTEDKDQVENLINRPAPFYFHFRYFLIRILNRLHKATNFKIYENNLSKKIFYRAANGEIFD